MSKMAILKELADIKALAGRKSAWKRAAVIAAVGYLLLGYGRDGWSYLTTASRMFGDSVRSNVPLEFELERARTMINGMIPSARQNMLVIAQEEVAVDSARRSVERGEAELAKQREALMSLRGLLDGNTESFSLAGRSLTRDEFKEEVARRFSRYQLAEATVASSKELLAAREKSFQAARLKLDRMLHAKRDLEVQVVNLESRLKTQQSHGLASAVEVNDSEVARCQTLVDDIRVRLEVTDRLLASAGDLGDLTSLAPPPSGDIAEQIDRHFAGSSKPVSLADARR